MSARVREQAVPGGRQVAGTAWEDGRIGGPAGRIVRANVNVGAGGVPGVVARAEERSCRDALPDRDGKAPQVAVPAETAYNRAEPREGGVLPIVDGPVLSDYIPAGSTPPADLPTVPLPVALPNGHEGRYVAIQVTSDCMAPAGIEAGSYVVVDREASPRLKSICVLSIDGGWTLKRLVGIVDGIYVFAPDDRTYDAIEVRSEDARIQGVVVKSVTVKEYH